MWNADTWFFILGKGTEVIFQVIWRICFMCGLDMIDDFKSFEESTKIHVRKFLSEFDCGISFWFVGAASYDTNLVGDFNAVEIHFPVIQFCLSALLGFEKPANFIHYEMKINACGFQFLS